MKFKLLSKEGQENKRARLIKEGPKLKAKHLKYQIANKMKGDNPFKGGPNQYHTPGKGILKGREAEEHTAMMKRKYTK